MILGIYEYGIVRASGHACFAANADGLVEVDNSIRAFEHCGSRTGIYTGSVSALIAPRNLMCSSHLWKDSNVNVFDIGARNRKRHNILGFTCCSAGVAADTASVVNYLSPFHGFQFVHS